ncbi:MFS transporter [Metabacillus sp. GX 13764]|uniref:MFS transporter n=1 Tax=Metabacillus kandeliae TaxID=2900151 RepID=UPI001E408002|nr:MFS transporter [Metabacillus kandeliae]MCD7035838.1 MFS transporter [Metabacillus kandeliae]
MSVAAKENPFLGTHTDLFKNKYVQSILLSALILQSGIWIRNMAVLLYIADRTNGSPLAVSLVAAAEYGPIFLFSFIGGTFADRWRPKKTMVWSDMLSGISVLSVLAALAFGIWQAIFLALVMSSTLSQFSQPSGMKLLKKHVREEALETAISVYQAVFALFMAAGPVLGTLAYSKFGINGAILFTAGAFFLSAAVLALIPENHERKVEKEGLLRDMKLGFQYIWGSRGLKLLGTGFALSGLAMGLIQPMNIFLVTEKLGLSETSLQWLLMVNGIGMLTGGALMMVFGKKWPTVQILAAGMLASAAGLSVIGFSSVLWLTLAAEFVIGFFLPAIQISIQTLIMKNTDEGFIGRVNGFLTPLFTGSMTIAISAAGQLKRLFSLTLLFEAAALLFFIGLLLTIPLHKWLSIQKE